MGEIVNLRDARKRKDREAAQRRASSNAAFFGLTKSERALYGARRGQIDRTLDGARRERASATKPSDDGES